MQKTNGRKRPTFYDLMKFAKTGIPAPDMTAWDKARALAIGGSKVQTLTGIPPLTFKADGTPLISWSMKGNGQQSGTPTPDAPIQPTFCGARTESLINPDSAWSSWKVSDGVYRGTITQFYTLPFYMPESLVGKTVTAKCYISGNLNGTNIRWRFASDGSSTDSSSLRSDGYIKVTFTISSSSDNLRIYYGSGSSREITITEFMINEGSTALPYEPFGYKIPITCAGQTMPVYLGQVSTVRRVKKLVLTGEESTWSGADAPYWQLLLADKAVYNGGAFCTHFSDVRFQTTGERIRFYVDKTVYDTATAWKTYLAQQYQNGTPVTVWYVLSTPTTGIVNEPLCKIGDYADELSSTDAAVTIPTAKGQNTLTVDTTLQPSEMTITYKG